MPNPIPPLSYALYKSQKEGFGLRRDIICLMQVLRLDPARVHIIGHSLGAHIAGYAGERLPGQN